MQVHNKKNIKNSTDDLAVIAKSLSSYVDYKRHFLRGFLYGMGGFFGATLGVAIVVGILTWSLSRLQVVPIVGSFATQVVEFVQFNLNNENNNKTPSIPLPLAE